MKDAASAVVLGSLETWHLLEEEREFLLEQSPAGITLFSRNVKILDDGPDLALLRSFTLEMQASRPAGTPPLMICIDQEGGRVARLKSPFPNRGPALNLEGGEANSDALAGISAYGGLVGEALKRLGINVNFAPVVDVLTQATNHAIGDRAFGIEPLAVTRRAEAFLQGMQETGVLGCLKHFPGQGDACVDTHEGAAVIGKSLEALQACELVPYGRLLAQSPMVMISHCLYPDLDPDAEATLSARIIRGLLKERMGYQGLVVSDDMTMGAIARKPGSWVDHIVTAIDKGTDLVLICRGLSAWREALIALRQQAKESPAFRNRLNDAAERVSLLRDKLIL